MFETQKFEYREVDGRVKSKAAFVWAQSGVELNTIATIDLDLVLVVFPDHTKLDDSLRNGSNLKGSLVFGVLLEEGGVLEGGDELWRCRYGQLQVSKSNQSVVLLH